MTLAPQENKKICPVCYEQYDKNLNPSDEARRTKENLHAQNFRNSESNGREIIPAHSACFSCTQALLLSTQLADLCPICKTPIDEKLLTVGLVEAVKAIKAARISESIPIPQLGLGSEGQAANNRQNRWLGLAGSVPAAQSSPIPQLSATAQSAPISPTELDSQMTLLEARIAQFTYLRSVNRQGSATATRNSNARTNEMSESTTRNVVAGLNKLQQLAQLITSQPAGSSNETIQNHLLEMKVHSARLAALARN